MLSFSMPWSGLDVPAFFTAPFFCFFALGGVLERSEPWPKASMSDGESSSPLSGLARFLDAVLEVVKVVCVSFFPPAFGAFAAEAFLGAAFAFGFCRTRISN
jgi:hypothetical protein